MGVGCEYSGGRRAHIVGATRRGRVHERHHAGRDQDQTEHQQQRADDARATRLRAPARAARVIHRTSRRPGRAC